VAILQQCRDSPKLEGGNTSPTSSKIANASAKTTVTTADHSSLEDSSDDQAQQQQQQHEEIQTPGETSERFHFIVTQNRCSNPDPEANAVSPSQEVLVPKVIRVSAVRPKLVRPIPSKVFVMTAIDQGGMGAGMVDDAQIDFPVSTLHNQGPAMARPQHAQIPFQTAPTLAPNGANGAFPRVPLSRRSPAGSQASVSSASVHPTPLFQRLVTEEVQEIKVYTRRIEQQNRRLAELERVHRDLEMRLQIQADRREELENMLQERERGWAEQISDLQSDRDHWKELVQLERNKNARLMDQVARKDIDIHRMLKRKYDLQDRDSNVNHTMPTSAVLSTITRGKPSEMNQARKLLSPQAILAESGSAEEARQRNVVNSMLDFFGMH